MNDGILIRGIVQASLELACLRHNLCLEDSPPMVVEEVSEIVTDTFNALQGIDCCDEQPCKEWTEIVRALNGAHTPPPDEELVIEIARELYDRFVMGGWEPQDAYPQIREWMGRAGERECGGS